ELGGRSWLRVPVIAADRVRIPAENADNPVGWQVIPEVVLVAGTGILVLQDQRGMEIGIVRRISDRDDVGPGRLVLGQGELTFLNIGFRLDVVRIVNRM